MGKVNVYLPDDLERLVRDAGVPVSAVCQAALRAAVDAVAALRDSDRIPPPEPAATLTPRLRQILGTGPATALELLGEIILHGENLGARVLADLGVELPPPRRSRSGASGPRAKPAAAEVREVLVAAYRVALELGHDYVGAEHVVIALARPDAPTAELFAALGLDERSVRARVVGLLRNPWRADAPGAGEPDARRLDHVEAELRRLTEELAAIRRATPRRP